MGEVLWLSVKVAAVAVLLTLPAGLLVGWVLARKRFPGRALLDAVVFLPLVLPPVVTGYALLWLLSAKGPLGGLGLAFTWQGAALAAGVVAFPLMVRAIRLGFEGVDRRLEEAARTLGARPRRVFWTVTLPLSWPGIVSGAMLAFGRALGEFGATVTFVGNIEGETRTLPLALHTALSVPGPEAEAEAAALAWLATGLAVATLLAGEWLARRAPGRPA